MYCSAPWTSLQIKNNGTMTYCCVSRDPHGTTLNSNDLEEGRQQIIEGKVLPACQSACFDVEENKLYASQRTALNNRFPIQHNIGKTVDPNHIQYIDLRMGNICNFTCIMCGDRDSHLWGKIHKKENPYVSWQQDRYDEIIDFIFSCKNLKCISLAGGEPFYNKRKLFGLVDKLDRSIELKFITNASFCDNEIIDKLNEFNLGRLHCSIDGVGRWIENQRVKADWPRIEKNMFNFVSKLHNNWTVNLVPTFTVVNTLGLPEYVDWYFNKLLSYGDAKFSYTICKQPEYWSLYQIPVEKRKEAINIIKEKEYNYSSLNKQTLFKLYDNICKDIIVNQNKDSLIHHVNFINNNVKLDFKEQLPELGEIFE